jgi:hypothetical protein
VVRSSSRKSEDFNPDLNDESKTDERSVSMVSRDNRSPMKINIIPSENSKPNNMRGGQINEYNLNSVQHIGSSEKIKQMLA